MGNRMIFVTGGQRSGKSEFAEKLALSLSDTPVYLATSQVDDDEFRERVRLHRERRGPQWTTVEEAVRLSEAIPAGRTVLIDCVTLWASNCFFEKGEDASAALGFMADEMERISAIDGTKIFVTNEIGLGGVSENAMRRGFTDLQGKINQIIAEKSQEAYFVVSGIPMKIK